MKIPPIDLIEAERELCSRSLSHFVRRAWRHIIPDEYIHGWHVDALSEHYEAVARGEITRLVINQPPGTMKSTMGGVMFPAWQWGPNKTPQHRYIGAAHEQGLAVRDARLMRELVTSEWYQRLWPLKLKGDQNEKLYFENEARGFRQACAVASMTGRRGHTITWDDPLSPEKAHSATYRETALRVLDETLPTRLNDPKTSAIIIIMQRLHEDDPTGHVLAKELGYEHLCLPMEFEPKRKCVTSIGWQDPRKEEGELLFPERFPIEVVERDKKSMGSYASAGQFQQRPSPAGGGYFKDEWWRWYDHLPQLNRKIIFADTAMKAKEQNDFSVFQCWGYTSENRAYLIDQVRGKWEAPELLRIAQAFYEKHKQKTNGASLQSMRVEDKASGTGLIQSLKKKGGVPIKAIKRETDKITRALGVVSYAENGQVYLPNGAAFTSDFLSETSAFPNGAHDDQVDPMIDALEELSIGASTDYSKLL